MYCQCCTRLGLELMLVKFIPYVLKISSASANAPGEEWLTLKETRVFCFPLQLPSWDVFSVDRLVACLDEILAVFVEVEFRKIKNLVVLSALSSILVSSTMAP